MVRDTTLPHSKQLLAYADVFVDDFVAAAQDRDGAAVTHKLAPISTVNANKSNHRRVRRILLHAINDVFRPLDSSDPTERQEPVSVKK